MRLVLLLCSTKICTGCFNQFSHSCDVNEVCAPCQFASTGQGTSKNSDYIQTIKSIPFLKILIIADHVDETCLLNKCLALTVSEFEPEAL